MSGKIMVIDDDLLVRTMIQHMLESAGFEVVTAGSAREGLDQFVCQDFALVVSDIMMPEMDGFALTRELKQRCSPEMPVLLISAMPESRAVTEGLESGAPRAAGEP